MRYFYRIDNQNYSEAILHLDIRFSQFNNLQSRYTLKENPWF